MTTRTKASLVSRSLPRHYGLVRAATPTATELAVLRVLWRRKTATVREVHEEIYRDTDTGYTSALKIMQNMLAKGLVTRVAKARQHVYAAAVSQRPTLNRIVRNWMDGAFNGSSLALAMQALDARPVDAEELAQLKAMITKLENAGDGA